MGFMNILLAVSEGSSQLVEQKLFPYHRKG